METLIHILGYFVIWNAIGIYHMDKDKFNYKKYKFWIVTFILIMGASLLTVKINY